MESFVLGIVNWLSQFSYVGIMLALTIEFIPAEVVLPMAGYWVYEGKLNYYLTVLFGTLGGTLGPLTLYALGRYGGRPFLQKYGKYVFIREHQLEKSDAFFQKHGNIIAFTGRFIPGVRTLISIPCGIGKMNVWLFSALTFAAMLPITAFYVYLGMQFGSNQELIEEAAARYLTPIGLGAMLFTVGFVVYRIKRNKPARI